MSTRIGPSEKFEDCVRVARVTNVFLEFFEGAHRFPQPDTSILLSLTYFPTSWKISEDKGKKKKEIENQNIY